MTLYDLARDAEVGNTGGLYTQKNWLTPDQCKQLAIALNRIEKSMNLNAKYYLKAYDKYLQASRTEK